MVKAASEGVSEEGAGSRFVFILAAKGFRRWHYYADTNQTIIPFPPFAAVGVFALYLDLGSRLSSLQALCEASKHPLRSSASVSHDRL